MNVASRETLQETESLAAADAAQAIIRFLRVLRHKKAYVFMSLAVAGLLGGFYYFTATRIYRASAQLLVTQSGSDAWSTSMISKGERDKFIPTYVTLISSSTVLEGAIAELATMPPLARRDLAGAPREKWVDIMRRNLSARGARGTNIIELSYKSRAPDTAEAVVNAVVNSYMKFIEENHKNTSVQFAGVLEAQRAATAEELHRVQQRQLEIKQEGGIIVREGSQVVHPIVQRAIELNESLIESQKQRIELEASLAAIRDAVRNGSDLRQHLVAVEPIVGRELIMSGLGLNSQHTQLSGEIETKLLADQAKLQTLRMHLGPTHHDILELEQNIENAKQYLSQYQANTNARLNGLHKNELGPMLISMVEEKLAETWALERQLQTEYERAEDQAVKLNGEVAELQITENEVTRLTHLHDTLLERIGDIDLNRERGDIRVNVISEPMAGENPVSPQLSVTIVLCFLGGLGAGAVTVYVQDLLDDRFRSPEEMKEQTGTPLLAMVQKLSPVAEYGVDAVQMHTSRNTVETEAFRTLRTSLAFMGDELQCIAVTSSEPGDGKTTILTNLGASYAQAGNRTLLIDADLRRPGLSKLFQFRGLGGLSEVLRSDQDLRTMCGERVRETGIDKLDVLPCGPKPPDPAELLSGTRFYDTIAWAQASYDIVLVDCPPVMAASDAAVVGQLSDGMLLVIQPGKNSRHLVLRSIESLESVNVRLVGIVANRVGDENSRGYDRYGYGYGYGYGYSYDQEEDGSDDQVDEDSSDDVSRHADTSAVPRRAA